GDLRGSTRSSHPSTMLRTVVRRRDLASLSASGSRRTVEPLFEHVCEWGPPRDRAQASEDGGGSMGTAIRETAPVQAGREDREERLARARAVLGTAERSAARWGGRIDRTALRSLGATESSTPAPPRPVEADESVGTR